MNIRGYLIAGTLIIGSMACTNLDENISAWFPRQIIAKRHLK
jgi:hypothetical protein